MQQTIKIQKNKNGFIIIVLLVVVMNLQKLQQSNGFQNNYCSRRRPQQPNNKVPSYYFAKNKFRQHLPKTTLRQKVATLWNQKNKAPQGDEALLTTTIGNDNNKNDNGDDDDKVDDLTRWVIRKVLDVVKDSEFIKKKHIEHVESDGVTHLLKGTPFAAAPRELKLRFVDSWAGRALSTVIREEGVYLRDWKIDCICEAAAANAGSSNNDDVAVVNDEWGPRALSQKNDIVVYSFEDCPWCIAAEDLLRSHYTNDSETKMIVVELETLGPMGKQLRAILAKETGRTSMPCIYIKGTCIGGFTDGEPCGIGLKALHETGRLKQMLH